jgi:hypothetical protein
VRHLKSIQTFFCVLIAVLARPLSAQDLSPRAYLITPVRFNAVTLTWSYYNGGVNFNGAVPITGATGSYQVPIFTYYHSFDFFGRSANVAAFVPYGVGTFQGQVNGQQQSIYRSGMLDAGARLSVNLFGGRSMAPKEFGRWKQKILIGASLKVIAPTGQYSADKLVNWGINRWAFKPELGYSQRIGHWLIDGYAGAWFYTLNPKSFALPVPQPQTEKPIGSFEGHLSRDFGNGTWVSVDGNFWWGGLTSLNGISNPVTEQTSSRIGGTAAWRFAEHQSLKFSYSDGTYIRFGGNYQSVSLAWQYSWLGWAIRH